MERLICSHRKGNLFILSGQELKHLRALRLKPGDALEVFCEGRVFLCTIRSLDRSQALCQIEEEIVPTPLKPTVILYQCVPVDIRKMDDIVDSVSQVGAERLVPVISSRSFQNERVIRERRDRWERLALSSMKQCKRPSPLIVDEPISLEDLEKREEVGLFLDSFSIERGIRDIPLGRDSYGVLVGPEGGLSVEEVKGLEGKGFLPVFIRPYIMRSEIAGTVAVALVINLAC
ncbi:MAG: 16S rRNA (uracil(1498)-N(3))-methyltransferase [Acidobacteria bacterium]|jgi:16S rRNA (uracil1498-N3)-methyltransferase|nr:MAG: 16S rRNA (uracil(1498)-N(3))-methyltransferase [Acidobacteriota bacterium]